MPIAYAGRRAGTNGGAGSGGQLLPVTSATTAGATLALYVTGTTSTGTAATVTDPAGNTWTKYRTQVGVNGQVGFCDLWVCPAAAALAAGQNVTMNFGASTFWVAALEEFSGVQGTPLDVVASATNASTAASSGPTAATAQADELLLGLIGDNTTLAGVITPGAGWTALGRLDRGGTFPTLNPLHRIVSATGAYSADATLGTSRRWVALIAALKGAAAPAGATRRPAPQVIV